MPEPRPEVALSDPTRSAPSPWLLFAASLALSFGTPAVMVAVSSGRHEARTEALERRQDKQEGRLEAVVTQQASASRETGEVRTELNGMRSEMARLANALERIADRK